MASSPKMVPSSIAAVELRGHHISYSVNFSSPHGMTKHAKSRSDKAGHPQWFVLGVGQVIKGLDIGMMDMCPGEKRKITVPPALAFGVNGKGPVPPNATVVFEVEVFSVSRGPRSMEAFGNIDIDKDRSLTKAEVKDYLKLSFEKDGKPRDDPFYEKILNDIFRKSDSDKDGFISAKEFNIYQHDEL
uniref:peptidyl-prolyl cis-trans isomerase FKBP7 isoform X1 n=1 Tax=Doryrhamphus excisus TaxID=161450 RepID=UPI0025AE392F|nr:peptidyl-prolyl cis-trans isomerase FKBP7 isoform X1 [Doryrhamphus excisus]XP_057937234.1 peptidyl-prolyl cis-trans isomerase FKBP7 isoform X1 [Doryrhamphus excisus]XP_057937235.1 peptidyl-prolyl cis-trans isomerase FKBP7 isoform X1 [Doryrhamphus excisus]XP_057937236.1 peptidyl-prolyl cis-trans isomerase FKBP7 isoform X1 [Doryrhamphus excisus]